MCDFGSRNAHFPPEGYAAADVDTAALLHCCEDISQSCTKLIPGDEGTIWRFSKIDRLHPCFRIARSRRRVLVEGGVQFVEIVCRKDHCRAGDILF